MKSRADPVVRATTRGSKAIADVIADLREMRLRADLNQASVARRVGVSRSRYSRIERGEEPLVPAMTLARMCGALGLDLSIRAYPGSSPLRDVAQVPVMVRLRARLGPAWAWRTEVVLAIANDQRAWDAMGVHRTSGLTVWIEVESRLRDSQAVLRRIATKKRDGAASRVLLIVPGTRNNRDAIRAASESFAEAFPADMRQAIHMLVRGDDPGADALLML
jgi:transcriptional regulator with XRE-family HTH domain